MVTLTLPTSRIDFVCFSDMFFGATNIFFLSAWTGQALIFWLESPEDIIPSRFINISTSSIFF